jgi:hypothetical protein
MHLPIEKNAYENGCPIDEPDEQGEVTIVDGVAGGSWGCSRRGRWVGTWRMTSILCKKMHILIRRSEHR